MFLNVIINQNKGATVPAHIHRQGWKRVFVFEPDPLYSSHYSFVYFLVWERERERGGRRDSPYVHLRQQKASVYLKAFRAGMIRGCEPNTFIRALHRGRSRGAPGGRIKMLRTSKKLNNLFQKWSGGDLETSMCERGRAEEWIKADFSVCVR